MLSFKKSVLMNAGENFQNFQLINLLKLDLDTTIMLKTQIKIKKIVSF